MLPHQEAETVQADAGGEVPSGAASPDDEANAWDNANKGLTWEDYGLTPPTPKGFVLNDGVDYIPFDICLPSGELKPAKYIKIKWGEDPLVYGMINGDSHQYVKSFQAAPMPSTGPLHTYNPAQLKFFKLKHNLHPEMDDAINQLHDHSAMAEVGCFHHNKEALKQDREELWQIKNNIWKW